MENDIIYPIIECEFCERFDHKNNKMRNKLFCTFNCEDYIEEMNRRAIAYNRAVTENFDNELYEHGKYVLGSGGK